MTHVEIWLGDGEKVIGSRWNNGKVQVFDSYKFDPKSFHSEQYHFKSIDTWLMGICRRYGSCSYYDIPFFTDYDHSFFIHGWYFILMKVIFTARTLPKNPTTPLTQSFGQLNVYLSIYLPTYIYIYTHTYIIFRSLLDSEISGVCYFYSHSLSLC